MNEKTQLLKMVDQMVAEEGVASVRALIEGMTNEEIREMMTDPKVMEERVFKHVMAQEPVSEIGRYIRDLVLSSKNPVANLLREGALNVDEFAWRAAHTPTPQQSADFANFMAQAPKPTSYLDAGFYLQEPPEATPEQKERIRGMFGFGEPLKAINDGSLTKAWLDESLKYRRAAKAGITVLNPHGVAKKTMAVDLRTILRHNGSNILLATGTLLSFIQTAATKPLRALSVTVNMEDGGSVILRGETVSGKTLEELNVDFESFENKEIKNIVGVVVTGSGWQEHFQVTKDLAYSFKGIPGFDHRVILPGAAKLLELLKFGDPQGFNEVVILRKHLDGAIPFTGRSVITSNRDIGETEISPPLHKKLEMIDSAPLLDQVLNRSGSDGCRPYEAPTKSTGEAELSYSHEALLSNVAGKSQQADFDGDNPIRRLAASPFLYPEAAGGRAARRMGVPTPELEMLVNGLDTLLASKTPPTEPAPPLMQDDGWDNAIAWTAWYQKNVSRFGGYFAAISAYHNTVVDSKVNLDPKWVACRKAHKKLEDNGFSNSWIRYLRAELNKRGLGLQDLPFDKKGKLKTSIPGRRAELTWEEQVDLIFFLNQGEKPMVEALYSFESTALKLGKSIKLQKE